MKEIEPVPEGNPVLPEGKSYGPTETRHWGRTVAANALSPFLAQIITKVLMLGYLVAQYRLIGGGANKLNEYIVAGIVLMYTSTISDWGLSTLLMREVARGRVVGGIGQSNWAKPNPWSVVGDEEGNGGGGGAASLFRETLTLRLLICLGLFLPVGLFILVYMTWFGLSAEGAWVTLLLTVTLLPGAFSGSVTALLYARERMSPPAVISIATSLLNVSLGVGALLLGWGIIGLALSALATTVVTAMAFGVILRRDFPEVGLGFKQQFTSFMGTRGSIPKGNPEFERDTTLKVEGGTLLKAGWPLMLNALLVGLFFRADQFIITAYEGDLAGERYYAAYSFLSFVLLITPAVTLALFPRMARHAERDRPRLAYEYRFALKVLVMLSVPLMTLTIWFAPLLIMVVTGGRPEFQPASVVVLQILILFLPLSLINGVTQYVLIALNRQHLITWAFGATVVFNLAANMVLVPLWGINGAAIATMGSELVLLAPFVYWTGKEIGKVRLGEVVWKPVVAGGVVGGIGWVLWPLQERWKGGAGEFVTYIGVGLLLVALYLLTIALLKPLSQEEVAGVRSALGRQAGKKA